MRFRALSVEQWLRFAQVTMRVQQVFLRRLAVTLHSVGGHVELLPHVDAHYRHWLRALRRREGFALRALIRVPVIPRVYEPPKATLVGNARELLARVPSPRFPN